MNKLNKPLKSIITLLFAVILLGVVNINAQTAVKPAGDGTFTPYQIATLENLYWVTQNPNEWWKVFEQTADIDASSSSGWDGGNGFTPIGNSSIRFTGTYDGNGFTIIGLFINRSSTFFVGMFGVVEQEANIKNLGLINIDITGSYGVGGLVGTNSNSTITACYTSGSVSNSMDIVGGLVGHNTSSGTISNSYSNVSVSSSNVNSDKGGLVGRNDGSISNSYSIGVVSGTNRVGGFAGNNTGTINNSFWDTQTSGQNNAVGAGSSTGISAKTTAEMKTLSTFTNENWDFSGEITNGTDDIWSINGSFNSGYPYLTWQLPPNTAPTASDETVNPNEGQTFVFYTLDFQYSDADSDPLNHIQITNEPAAGNLFVDLNNNGTNDGGSELLSSGSSVTKANLDANRLKYIPDGFTSSSFTFKVNDGTDYSTSSYTMTLTVNAQPTVTINQASGQNDPTSISPINFTVVFSETVTGFGSGDITLGGTASGSLVATVTGSGTTYNVAVAGMTGSGTVTASIAAGVASDAGNATNKASTSTDNTVTFNFIQLSGSGTSGDPYLIATLDDLKWVSENPSSWDKYFLQTADIDASSTSTWDGGSGFTPIGNGGIGFTGSYDGGGYTINGLYINNTVPDFVGMFGLIGFSGVVKNIRLVNVNITGRSYTGGLAGFNRGTITVCYSTGSVSGGSVGGLAGGNTDGTINGSYSTCSVSSSSKAGGLVGINDIGTISNSYSTGSVNGILVGGLVGENGTGPASGTITNSYSTGSVSGSSIYVGGLVGYGEPSDVTNSFWDTETSGQSSSIGGTGKTTAEMKNAIIFLSSGWDSSVWNIGDGINNGYPYLDWQNTSGTSLLASIAPLGNGTEGDPYLIANLDNLYWVTQNSSSWDKYFKQTADIDASSTSAWDGGAGFAPIGNSSIRFNGTYDGNRHTITGLYINRGSTDRIGFFGYTFTTTLIKNIGLLNVNITGKEFVGGLVGYNFGTITGSYLNGTVNGQRFVGGLVGANIRAISGSFSSGSVSAQLSDVGGIAGQNGSTGEITNSYSNSSVSGTAGFVGGLVGNNSSTGGYGTITNSYSNGSVSGTAGSVGGLVGSGAAPTITNSFWDKQTSGRSTSAGGTGKTTAEMKTISTYINSGWDLETETANGTDNIWDIDNSNGVINSGYPFLSWQNGSDVSIFVSAPTVGIGAPSNTVTNTGPVTFNITYNDAENINLTTGNITLNKTGTADGTVSVTNGTTANATVTVSGITGDGTLGISIAAGTSSNALGVADAGAGPSTTVAIDNTAPSGYTVSIDQAAINSVNNSSISFTFTGAEFGTTYNYSFSSSGGGTNVTGNGTITSADQQITIIDLSGLNDGTITLSVTLTDTEGNTGNAVTNTKIKDISVPTLSITSTESKPIFNSPFEITIIFSEDVTGFDVNDIIVGNGSLDNFTGSGTTYTVEIIPYGDGVVSVDIAEGVALDYAGNGNSSAEQYFLYDNTAPSGYTVAIDQSAVNIKNQNAISFTITGAELESEYNYNFSSSNGGNNVTGTGTITSTEQKISGIDLSGLNDGTITLSFTLTDQVGNVGDVVSDTKIKDVVPLSVKISSSETNAMNATPFSVTIEFSKNVNGFNLGDIIVGNGSKNNFTEVNSSQFTVDITPISVGIVTVEVAESVTQDNAGNKNTAAQFSITAANNPPVLAAIEEFALNYTEMDEATPITITISVSDLDNTNLSSAVISISGNYTSGEDLLSFTNQNGITGNWNSLTGSITLTGNASVSDYQTALRNIKYSNSSNNPNIQTRKISFTVNDGELNSNLLTREINIIAVNDPPVISFILSPLSINEDESITLSLRTLLPFISDPDHSVDELVLSFEYLGDNLIITELSDSLIHIQLKKNWHGLDSIIVKVSDGYTTTSAPFAINVISVNDLPEFINLPEIVRITDSGPVALVIFNLVSDVETPNNLLQFEFSTGNDSLLFNYDSGKGLLLLSALEGYKGETELKIKVTDEDGGESETTIIIRVERNVTGIEEFTNQLPTEYEVYQNYPNPFNPSTIIRYGLPEESKVIVMIYNILGQEVQTLYNGIQRAGYHEQSFNGSRLASGMYIYTIYAESVNAIKKYSQAKKMLMVK